MAFQRITRSRTKAVASSVETDNKNVLSRPSLEKLPLEVLQMICEYVDSPGAPGLNALSQASKHCLAATSKSLCREIRFDVTSRRKLQQDVSLCRTLLDSRLSWVHVHRISVEGSMPEQEHEPESVKRGLRPRRQPTKQYIGSRGYYGPRRTQQRYLENTQDDNAWKPLAKLLEDIPALTDILFNSPDQVPPCLLQTLHSHISSCRLHVKHFQLHILEDSDLDRHERALVTSPSLHAATFKFLHWVRGPIPRAEYEHSELVSFQWLVAGAAPNLREVRLANYTGVPTGFIPSMDEPGCKSVFLHVDNLPKPGRMAPLTTFSFGSRDHRHLNRYDLDVWSNYVDFSALRALELAKEIRIDALSWATTNCSFTSLETLVLIIEWKDSHELDTTKQTEVDDFVRSLPPLKDLKIDGAVGPSTFRAIVQHHASKLKRLWMGNVETWPREEVTSCFTGVLQEYPLLQLEDLTLATQRSKGDENEVAIYKTLGSMPRLQALDLTLDCADESILPHVPGPDASFLGWAVGKDVNDNDEAMELTQDCSFDDFHRQTFKDLQTTDGTHLSYGHIRDAFINSALDEKLARAIHQIMTAAKGPRSLPLQRLKLGTRGGCQFGSIDSGVLAGVCDYMGRPMLVECSLPGGGPTRLSVTQVEDSRDSYHPSFYNFAYTRDGPPTELDSQTEAVFRRLWPVKSKVGGSWQKEWHSLPLAEPAITRM
ncbi:MAG: Uncharacterized protein AUREO_017480 [Aureobasidium pullulans]|nr:MAG: Uncharacterized protein AUREO_017480 [Aureobasidium pullulans]